MSRLLAVIVVIALAAVALATRSSSAAGPGAGAAVRAGSGVIVTPKLKQLLQAKISTLRAAQPKALSAPRRFLTPDRGVPCFVAGGTRCSEIPCQEFASNPAVFKKSATEIISPGARRNVVAPSCPHRAPRKLVLVSGP